MDPLRLSLLLIGVVLIAGIYLWGRRRQRQEDEYYLLDDKLPSGPTGADDWDVIPLPRQADRSAPLEDGQLQELAGFSGKGAMGGLSPDEARQAFDTGAAADGTPQEALLVLTVIAQEGASFTGPTLSDLFEDLALHYGDMRIFHRIDAASRKPVFSVANIVEPGYFDLQQLPDLRTPGLALFMHLPGPVAGGAAFDDLLSTARRLAGALEGLIGDQQRHLLNEAAISRMRATARRFAPRP